MDRTIKIFGALLGIFILCAAAIFVLTGTQSGPALSDNTAVAGSSGNLTVYFFYGEECPHCHNIMPFMRSLQQKYPDTEFLFLETWHNQTNYAVYTTLNRELRVSRAAVPEAIVGNVVLIGEKDIPDKLEQALVDQLKKKN